MAPAAHMALQRQQQAVKHHCCNPARMGQSPVTVGRVALALAAHVALQRKQQAAKHHCCNPARMGQSPVTVETVALALAAHVALQRQQQAAKHHCCNLARMGPRPVACGPVAVPLAPVAVPLAAPMAAPVSESVSLAAPVAAPVAVRPPGKVVAAKGPVPMWEVAFLRPLAVGPMAQRRVQGHRRCLAPTHRCLPPAYGRPSPVPAQWRCVEAAHLWP